MGKNYNKINTRRRRYTNIRWCRVLSEHLPISPSIRLCVFVFLFLFLSLSFSISFNFVSVSFCPPPVIIWEPPDSSLDPAPLQDCSDLPPGWPQHSGATTHTSPPPSLPPSIPPSSCLPPLPSTSLSFSLPLQKVSCIDFCAPPPSPPLLLLLIIPTIMMPAVISALLFGLLGKG